jgi:hypothetical protein
MKLGCIGKILFIAIVVVVLQHFGLWAKVWGLFTSIVGWGLLGIIGLIAIVIIVIIILYKRYG